MADDQRLLDSCRVEFKIDGVEIGSYCDKFEWVCFVNCGQRIVASFNDYYQNCLREESIKNLLSKSKTFDGVDIEVRLWQHSGRKKGKKTEIRKFKVLTLNSNLIGSLTKATLDLVCVDNSSWYLNRGKCTGKAYKGNISTAIKEIINEHASGVSADIQETKDDKNNIWWDMRLDPKTLISSLIEWSSSITNNETPLIVHSQDDEFKCREWSSLEPTKNDGKKFYIASKRGNPKEINNTCTLKILSNNLLSPTATRLYTGGISATTGLYIDKDNDDLDDRHKFADDELTGSKLMPKVNSDQSYSKPDGDEGTFIMPVPEHNNGDVGIKYQDYCVGRARDWFIRTIYTSLRVKVTVEPGDTDFDSIYGCGRDKIILEVIKPDYKPYYINGNWLLYGFRHIYTKNPINWKTELLLSRLDHDSSGNPI